MYIHTSGLACNHIFYWTDEKGGYCLLCSFNQIKSSYFGNIKGVQKVLRSPVLILEQRQFRVTRYNAKFFLLHRHSLDNLKFVHY